MAVGGTLLFRPSHSCRNNVVLSSTVSSGDQKADNTVSHAFVDAAAATVSTSTATSRFVAGVYAMRQELRHTKQRAAAAAAAATTSSDLSCCHALLCYPRTVVINRGAGGRNGSSCGTSNSSNTSSNPSVVNCSSCSNGASSSRRITRINGFSRSIMSARAAFRNGKTLLPPLGLPRLAMLAIITALLFLRQGAAEGSEKEGPPGEGPEKPDKDQQPGRKGDQKGESQLLPEAPLPLARLKPTPTRENFTDAASDLFDCVEQLAFTMQHPELSRVHLIACILEMPGDTTVASALNAAGGDAEKLRRDMHDILIRMPLAEAALSYGEALPRPELRKLVVDAWRKAAAEKRQLVGVQDLIDALLQCDRFSSRLEKLGTNVETFRSLVSQAYRSHTAAHEAEPGKKKKPDWLNTYGVRLTDLARENKIGTALERDKEIADMQAILSRMTKPNCMLLGEPGVGKTALVEGLAHLIVNGQVSDALLGTEIYSLKVGALVSGSAMRGEFEKRITALLDYITASEEKGILFIDEIHTLMGAGKSEGPMDAANLLKPALARGQIRVIGATTKAEYRRYVEKDAAFARRFTVLEVKELSEEKTLRTLKGLRPSLEQHHKLSISDEALEAAVKLSSRYVRERYLPDKAIDVLDSACSLKNVQAAQRLAVQAELPGTTEDAEAAATKEGETTDEEEMLLQELDKTERAVAEEMAQKNDDGVVTAEDVARVISNHTGIAVHSLTESDKQKLLRLPFTLRERVQGQDEAIQAVAAAVMRSHAGLAHRKAPVGTFLFLGPPGVGKTELAKTLAVALYSDEKALVRFDMSEFSEAHTATRLVGSPPGYMNHEEGGQLTEAVRARPFSVVLLDELENAHPNVFPYLLQVLDEGRLTDSRGVTVDFRNCVIIATSNIGSQRILEAYEKAGGDRLAQRSSLGFFDEVNQQLLRSADADDGQTSAQQQHTFAAGSSNPLRGILGSRTKKVDYKAPIRKEIEADAGRRFTPQVVNRMKVVLFDPLDTGKLRKILQAQERELTRLFKEQQIEFEMNDSARNLLVNRLCSRTTGARDLHRYFEDLIAGPLSSWLLGGQLLHGMRILLTTSPEHKNSLVANMCKADRLGRCLPGTRRARVLSTIDSHL